MALDFNLYLSLAVLALAVFLAGLVETNAPERFSYPSFLQPAAVVSFGIYLWHPVTENLFLAFVWNKFIASQSSALFFVYIAGIMLLTVLVAIASFRFFETPMAAGLSRLSRRASNSRRTIVSSINPPAHAAPRSTATSAASSAASW
jgi:peptidoglycan/LPS O-acetylase OafA/YrhL